MLLTDLPAVTPLTRKNVDTNLSSAALQGKPLLFLTIGSALSKLVCLGMTCCMAVQGRDGAWGSQAGQVTVQDLDWGSAEDIARAGGPFSFVLAADCCIQRGSCACAP